jgi:hypothetical protein
MTTRPRILSESGREKSNRKDKGTKRSNYVLKPKTADDAEIEHAPSHRAAPVSLPVLRFLQPKLIGGETI